MRTQLESACGFSRAFSFAVTVVSVLLTGVAAQAANSYQVPCYVHPAHVGSSDLSVGAVTSLKLSADGQWVRYGTAAGSGAFRLVDALALSGTGDLRVRSGFSPTCSAGYLIGGVSYSVYVQGTSICLRRDSDQTVTTVVDDATHLNADAVAVRMSHADHFRPRIYVLLATGDVAVYVYRPDSGSAIWSKTLAAADLRTSAGAAAVASALEVTADGSRLIVAFGARLAVFKYTSAKWVYYDKDMAGNPTLSGDNVNCIADGSWVLAASWSNGKIYVGVSGATSETQGNGYLCGKSAEYLDLSEGYCYRATDDARFTMAGIVRFSLGSKDGVTLPRVILAPAFLDGFWQGTKGWVGVEGAFEEVVFDSSVMDWWSSWTSWSAQNRRLVFNLPSVKQFDSYSLYGQTSSYWGEGSDAADWNFPALTTVKDHACSYCKFAGTLTLPAVATIETEAFALTPNLTEVILSAEKKTLLSLADKAFYQTAGSIRKVTLGGASGLKLNGSMIFAGNPLREVTFTGAVPTFDADVTAWPDTAAESMVFVVPSGDATWQTALSGKIVRTLDEATRKAFHAANPDLAIPQAVVDKSMFATKYDQLLCSADSCTGFAMRVAFDGSFGDRVEIASDWAANADGTYPAGTKVTLRAVPDATGTFVKWYGDVPEGEETNSEITVTTDADLWLYARMTHPWTLSADRSTLSNGNYTVNVDSVDETKRTLKIGLNEAAGLFADSDWGSGTLDLGGPVFCAGDSTPWTIVGWGATSAKGALCGIRNGKGCVSTFLFPTTAVDPPYGQFFNGGTVADAVIMDMPDAYVWFEAWTCGGTTGSDITRFIVQMPRAERFNGAGYFWPQTLSETKAEWWDLSSLTYLHSQAWQIGNDGSKICVRGELKLPALTDIRAGESVAAESPFRNLACVTAYSFGDAAHPVTNVCAQAFAGNAALRKLTLHNAADIAVGQNPFKDGRVPDEIVLRGPLPSEETAFAALLSDVTAAAKKPVVIRIPRLYNRWRRLAYLDFDVTPAEKTEADGNVIAVYRGGAAAPEGKALLVADVVPTSFYIIVR